MYTGWGGGRWPSSAVGSWGASADSAWASPGASTARVAQTNVVPTPRHVRTDKAWFIGFCPSRAAQGDDEDATTDGRRAPRSDVKRDMRLGRSLGNLLPNRALPKAHARRRCEGCCATVVSHAGLRLRSSGSTPCTMTRHASSTPCTLTSGWP